MSQQFLRLACWVLLFASVTAGSPQRSTERPVAELFARAPIPHVLQEHVLALGARVKNAGKELTTLVGDVTDVHGKTSPARVEHQLPNNVRLEGIKGGNDILTFDGKDSKGATPLSVDDDDILEMFSLDTAEGLFTAAQEGTPLRFAGRGFRPDPAKVPQYSGPLYDIYEVVTPVPGRQIQRLKLYYFETRTGLLAKVQYRDRTRSPFPLVETRLSEWTTVDGSAYPRTVERYENGKRIFSFTARTIQGSPRQNIGRFNHP